jgi:hypothetical protein
MLNGKFLVWTIDVKAKKSQQSPKAQRINAVRNPIA